MPADQKKELISLFDEFEANETPEAKYAHALDNVQPLMINNRNDGADWREHGVSSEQVYLKHSKTRPGSEKLYEISDNILQANIEKGNIKR